MRLLRTALCILLMASPLAGCFSYSQRDEGYGGPYKYSYDHGYYYGDNYPGRTSYYYRHDED